MEVVVTTGGAISRAKFQSNHHHQQTNTQFFTGWMPFLSPNQQCQSTGGKSITVTLLSLSQAHWGVFQLSIWPLITPGYLVGGLPCHSLAHWSHYPNSNYVWCNLYWTVGDFTFWLSLWLRPKAELKLNLRAQLWSEPGLRIKYWLSPEFKCWKLPGSRFCKEGWDLMQVDGCCGER